MMPNISHRIYRPKQKNKKDLGFKKSKDWEEFYGDRRWGILRNWYRTEHPLCEVCLKEGRVVPMKDIHHLHVFRYGSTPERKWQLFLDPNNLCSLCREHHQKIHDYLNESQLEYVDLDTFVEYDKKEREMYINNSK